MNPGGVTFEQVEYIFNRMGLCEPVLIPYWEDGQIVGLITGYVGMPDHPERKDLAFLEHFIVLPEAKHKLRVMQQLPKVADAMLRPAGITHTVLFIVKDDPRRERLEKWATRCGYHQFDQTETRVWWMREIPKEAA